MFMFIYFCKKKKKQQFFNNKVDDRGQVVNSKLVKGAELSLQRSQGKQPHH